MFTEDSATYLTTLFDGIFDFFQINWPGTNVSIFGVFAGCIIGLFLFKLVAGFISGNMFSASPLTEKYRTNNKRVSNVPKDRKDDDK